MTTAPANRFIGREADLLALEEALKHARLVTVLGPAGMGKTRLAQEHTAKVSVAAIADLSDVHTAGGVVAAVGAALQLSPGGQQSLQQSTDAISRALAERGGLLVLDNLEQVADEAAPLITAWLAAAPDARLLLTSRERLAVTGEAVIELAPLQLNEASQLFVERARALKSGWSPTADDDVAIKQIATKLDCMPLAIELAAARVRVMTPNKMLERLGRRFDLLKSSSRDRSPRQATLRGAIDWSWDLLNGWERDALAQCSVFRGGFDLEAAESVLLLDQHLDAPPEMDAVQALRDKSLLRSREVDGGVRFAMYDTIRDYAAEKLEEVDGGPARQRHQHWYLKLGERLATEAVGPQGPARLRELAREEGNLIAVHQAALGIDADSAARAALALEPLLSTRGPWESLHRLTDVAVQSSAGGSPAMAAKALCARGNAVRQQGRMDEARADFTAALKLARDGNSPHAEGYALALLGIVARAVGEKSEADTWLDQALTTARGCADLRTEAVALVSTSFLRMEQDRHEQAEEATRRALVISREIGDTNVESLALIQLANMMADDGRLEQSKQAYGEAMTLARSTENRRTEGIAQANLGIVYLEQGRIDEASAVIEQAIELSRGVGNRRFEGIAVGYKSLCARERGELEPAAALCDRAISIHRDMGTVRWICEELQKKGLIALLASKPDDARSCFVQAIEQSGEGGLALQDGRSQALLGVVHADQGRLDEAVAAVDQAAQTLAALEDAYAPVLLELARGHIDLARAKTGDESGRGAAQARLAAARPVQAVSLEVRTGMRLLQAALARTGVVSGAPDPADAHPDSLQVGPGSRWFQAPGHESVDVSRRRVLRRILEGLVHHRQHHPGSALDTAGVLKSGWPGEKIIAEAGQNRVYVAIATLRKLGLGELLITRKDGYLLDPGVHLIRS